MCVEFRDRDSVAERGGLFGQGSDECDPNDTVSRSVSLRSFLYVDRKRRCREREVNPWVPGGSSYRPRRRPRAVSRLNTPNHLIRQMSLNPSGITG